MKTNYRKQLVLCVALLALVCTHTASAFYNPTTGRWLSRDSIGENGGINLIGFAANSPAQNYDALGNACAPMQVIDLGKRPAQPLPGTNFPAGWVLHGVTSIRDWTMSATVERCFELCRYKARIRACWASVQYWYDSDEWRDHELIHVNIFQTAWANLCNTVEGLAGNCVSQRKASCYAQLIELYSNYYYQDGHATNFEFDCNRLGGDPNLPDCQAAKAWRDDADIASARVTATSARCEAMQ